MWETRVNFILEHFYLGWTRRQRCILGTPDVDDFAVLPVGDLYNAHLTFRGGGGFSSTDVDLRALVTGAMSTVNAELQHAKAILQQCLPKVGGRFALFLCVNR